MSLPPPPIREQNQNTTVWQAWYRKISEYLAANSFPWAFVDKTGSSLNDIQTRPHSALQSILGSGAHHLSSVEHAELTGGGITALHSHAGSAATWNTAEIDAGTKPTYDLTAVIVDAAITPSDKIVIAPDATAPAGRTADDWQWDGAILAGVAGTGQFTLYATFHPGPIVGKRSILYQVA